MDEFLTLAQAAELLLLAPTTLRTQVHRGRLAARLIGKTWIITRDELERYRNEHLGRFGRPRKFELLKGRISPVETRE